MAKYHKGHLDKAVKENSINKDPGEFSLDNFSNPFNRSLQKNIGKDGKEFYTTDSSIYGEYSSEETVEEDAYLQSGFDQETFRADHQSAGEQLASGLASRVPSIGTKFIQGIGHVGGFGADLVTGNVFEGELEYTTDNPVSNTMAEWDEGLKEAFPVYRSKQAKYGDFWESVGTTSFIANDVFDGLAFLGSALIPGGAFGRMGKMMSMTARGSRVSRATSRLSRGAEEFADIGLGLPKKVSKRFGAIAENKAAKTRLLKNLNKAKIKPKELMEEMKTMNANSQNYKDALRVIKSLNKKTVNRTAAYNSVSEAGFEAKGVYDDILSNGAYEKYGKSFDQLSESEQEELETDARKAANGTFYSNVAALYLPNKIQAGMFFGKHKTNASKLRKAFKNKKNATDIKEFAKKYKQSYLKNIGKNVGKGVVAEGFWEENIQMSVEDFEKDKVYEDDYSSGLKTRIAKTASGMVENLFDDEKKKGILVGAVLGSLGGIKSGFSKTTQQHKEVEEEVSNIEKELDRISEISKRYKKNTGSLLKTFKAKEDPNDPESGEIDTYINPETGEKEFDPEKLSNFIYRNIFDGRLADTKTMAAIENDPVASDFVSDIALSQFAYDHFTNEYYQSTEEALEGASDRLRAIAREQEGVSEQEVEEKVRKLSEFKEMYENTEFNLDSIEDFDANIEGYSDFKDMVKANVFYESVKKKSLERSRENVSEDSREGFDKVIETSEKRLQKFQNKKERRKLAEEYNKKVQELIELREAVNESKDSKESVINRYNQTEFLETRGAVSVKGQSGSRFGLMAGRQAFDATASEFDSEYDKLMKEYVNSKEVSSELSNKKKNLYSEGRLNREGAKEFLEYAEDNKKYLSEEDINEVENISKQLQKDISSSKNKASKLQEESVQAQVIEEDFEKSESLDSQAQTEEELSRNLESLYSKTSSILDNKDQIVERNKALQEEVENEDALSNALMRRFSENYTVGGMNVPKTAQSILDNFDPETSTNYKQIREVVSHLQDLKTVWESEERSEIKKSKQFKGFDKWLNDLINELQEKEAIAQENKTKRDKIQENIKERNDRLAWKAFGVTEESEGSILDKIRSVLNSDTVDELINKARSHKMEGAFLYTLLNKLKSKGKADTIIKELDKRKAELIDQLTKKAGAVNKSKLEVSPASVTNVFNDRSFWGVKNPLTNTDTALYTLHKTHDIAEFLENIQSNESKELHERAEMVAELESISRALNALNSEVTFSDQIGNEIESLEEGQLLYPTHQQISAIREIVQFFKQKKFLSKGLGNSIFLKGDAGTGKTKVVAKLALKLAGIKPENVFSFGASKPASQEIATSLGSKQSSLSSFLEQEDFSETEVIVIDEAAALEFEDFAAVRKKIKKIREQKDIPVLFLGDPSQITSERFPEVSEDPTIHSAPPLSVVYRTDVAPIVDVVSQYQDNSSQVEKVGAVSNYPIDETKKDVTGAHVGPRKKILDILKTTEGNGRSKAVIVNNQDDKIEYQNKVGEDVEVLTYKEAQGRSIEEVYVDIEFNKGTFDGGSFQSQLEFNKAMYTATSRAQQYLYVVGEGTNASNSNLDSLVSNSSEETAQIEENYKERLNEERGIVNQYLDNKVGSKVGKKSKKEDQEDYEEEVDNEEDPEADNTYDTENQDETETEEYPEASTEEQRSSTPPGEGMREVALNNPEKLSNENRAKVKPGSRVVYVPSKINGKEAVGLFAQTESGSYVMVGVLDSQEFEDYLPESEKESIKNDFKSKKLNNRTSMDSKVLKSIPNYDIGSTLESIKDIKYNYDKNKTDSGKGLINRALKKWKDTFKPIKKYSVKLKISTSGSISGFPYLEITMKNKEGEPYKQFVVLSNRKLRTSDNILNPIKEASRVFESIEEATGLKYGTEEFTKLITAWKKNFKVVDGNRIENQGNVLTEKDVSDIDENLTVETLNDIQGKLDSAIQLLYTPKQIPVKLSRKAFNDKYGESNEEYEFEPFNYRQNKDETEEFGYLVAVKKGDKKRSMEMGLSRKGSKLQKSLNKLAAANPNADFAFQFDKGGKKVTRSYSVLPESYQKGVRYKEFLNEEIQKILDNPPENMDQTTQNAYSRVKSGFGSIMDKENLLSLTGRMDFDELGEYQKTLQNPVMDLELLDSILQEPTQDSYLRFPIEIGEVKNNEEDIDYWDSKDIFETGFQSVSPARVSVTAPERKNSSEDFQETKVSSKASKSRSNMTREEVKEDITLKEIEQDLEKEEVVNLHNDMMDFLFSLQENNGNFSSSFKKYNQAYNIYLDYKRDQKVRKMAKANTSFKQAQNTKDEDGNKPC